MNRDEHAIAIFEENIEQLLARWQRFCADYANKQTFIDITLQALRELLTVAEYLHTSLQITAASPPLRQNYYQQLSNSLQGSQNPSKEFTRLTCIKAALDSETGLQKLKQDYQSCQNKVLQQGYALQRLFITIIDTEFNPELKNLAATLQHLATHYLLPYKQQILRIDPYVVEEETAQKGITLDTVTKVKESLKQSITAIEQKLIVEHPLLEWDAFINQITAINKELLLLKNTYARQQLEHEIQAAPTISSLEDKSYATDSPVASKKRTNTLFLRLTGNKSRSPKSPESDIEKVTINKAEAGSSIFSKPPATESGKQLAQEVINELKKTQISKK